jgi:iron complex outermembrane receptor protein
LHADAQSAPAPSGPAPSGSANATTNPSVPSAAATPATVGTKAPATALNTEEMAPIIVTGSAIPTTDAEGASPVTVVDSATIEKRGYQTVTDILRNVTANGSFSSPGQTSNAFAGGAAYVSLRGLGPQATLVLINGRRVTDYAAAANGQYAFVDLNSIPAQIVDHVEILTEGTALYGADAVAGVVNIITKKDLPGNENGEVDAYIGNTDNKDAFEQRYTLMGNLGSFDKNGFGVVEADYEHQDSILAPDREVSKTADQATNGGFDLRSGRTFPGIFEGETSGNDFSILPGTGNVPLTGTTNAVDPHVDDGADALQPYDYNTTQTIIPDTTRYGVYMNYTYKFYDGNITPNIDFDYRHNRTVLISAPGGYSFFDGDPGPSELSGATSADPSAPAGTPVFRVPTTNPFNQTGEVIDVLSYRFVPLGPRTEDADVDLFRVVPSVDFKLGDGWTLNAGFNYSYSFLDDRNVNFASASAFQDELNDPNPARAYNPFTSSANQSAAAINGLYVSSGNRDTTSQIGTDFRFNGKLFDLPAGPVQMAFGGEFRLERYNQSYGPEDLSGDVVSSSIQLDTAASQKALSGYTEVDIPLTSPSFNIPGFYSTDVLVAGRVDKYSQFGSTENPQVRLRWEIIPGLIVRGGYSTSFRAPSLNELAAGGNQAFETILDPNGGGPGVAQQSQVLINSPGNPNLKPETAETFSAGVAYSPEAIKGLLMTVDYFKIRYENQIQQEDPQTLINAGSPNVTLNPNGTIKSVLATYENLSNSHIDGFDLGANYVIGDPNISWGQLDLSYSSTILLNYITDDGTGASENVGIDSGGLGPYSRYRQDVTATWNFHNFSFTVANDLSSSYADSEAAPTLSGTDANNHAVERNVGTYITFDLQASYTFDKQDIDKWAPGAREDGFDWRNIVAGTTLTVGCNNVYDFQPPFTANPSDTLGYDPAYADPTGRFIYGQISKKF